MNLIFVFTGVEWLVCDTSSLEIIEVKHTYPQPVTGLVSSLVLDSRTPHNPVVSKNIWNQRLVKQLWPPDGCRRTEGRLSTSLAEKGCVLSTLQERSGLMMEKSAARLQPLVDQEKPIQHQIFAIEKFQDLIVTTRSCPGD